MPNTRKRARGDGAGINPYGEACYGYLGDVRFICLLEAAFLADHGG